MEIASNKRRLPGSEIRTPDGASLAVEVSSPEGTGNPEATVIFVHGAGFSSRHWARASAFLAASGYRAVTYDLRGFGESSVPESQYVFPVLVDDLRAVADHLGLERFHLVGHSLGGMIAMQFALDCPGRTRSLTLVSTTAHNGKRASSFGRIIALVARHGFDHVAADRTIRAEAEQILRDGFDPPPPLEFFRRGLEQPNPGLSYAWAVTAEFSVKDRLGEIACPAWVLHGDADQVVPFAVGRAVHQGIAHSRWTPFAGAGHTLPFSKHERFNPMLLDWLRENESQTG